MHEPWVGGATLGPVVVLPAVQIVDADGHRGVRWVVLRGPTIQGVYTAPPSDLPPDARYLPVAGGWVAPGLIDPHVHLSLSGASVDVGPTTVENLRAQLWFGVTTVIDAGGPAAQAELAGLARSPGWQGPDLRVLSPFITTPGGHPCEIWNDPERCWFSGDDQVAIARVRGAADRGFDGIKLAYTDAAHTPWPTPRIPDAVASAAVREARARGLLTYAHTDTPEEASRVLDFGVEYLAHPPFGGVPTPEQAVDLAGRARAIHTTFSAFDGTSRVVNGEVPRDELAGVVPAAVLSDWEIVRGSPGVLASGWLEENAAWASAARDSVRALDAAGAVILPASDAGYLFVPHGAGLHDELDALVQAGWSSERVFSAVTAGAADALNLEDRGRIQPGLRADLLVLDGDPRVDHRYLRNPTWIVAGGHPWTRSDLATRWAPLVVPRARAAGSYCWDGSGCESGACDPATRTCTDSCAVPGAFDDGCGPEATCVAGAHGPVCASVRACDLLDPATTCSPAWYAETCVPVDRDTSACWPAGPKREAEACGFFSASTFCEAGLYCSVVDATCWRPCDLTQASRYCGARACLPVEVDGEVWFGVCARGE